jgi:uncharacterized protein
MNGAENTITIKDNTSNPAPLGLFGFGMTTILLNLHNIGFFGLNAMIMGMGLFLGGMAQVMAGHQEWKKNNTFGAVAFTAYGFFWITLGFIWLLPKTAIGADFKSDEASMGWFLLLWGIFSFGMFLGTLRMSRALQFVFGTLVLLFLLLAIGDFASSPSIKIAGGYVGIICGLGALYTCMAQILNEVYGEILLPLGTK